ncbi:hypothetical protein DSM106972_085600 [Dulcicalothrix desertica PCC 7102]|uniref:DUF4351 domain-containing protein n=1 Tax=Dulcicalothrix desertica PCC 7102 TaxID=232991 RepID=A0A433UT50_9CYAN|nr:DUF4351 domain-containing protein [Dulcicalothrix desertica]RUS97010.1 hypothetical protein DSM106972_085600 [Dulcicalothrix desertica PCC 7102]TWH53983.1 uncharacterized protein DUF4351 [Dulcicalothrix desertica PCC 7102]
MTRFIHDQFSKDFIESLLAPFGSIKAPSRVAAEVKMIDILFTPRVLQNPELAPLGLLGKFAEFPAIIEPFRNPVQEDDISDCIIRVLEVQKALQREAKRNKTVLSETAIPKQWILTPTISDDILSKCKADPDANWMSGVYLTADILRTAIVAIHELPSRSETLWLRMLGRDTTQKNAIDEFISLSDNNSFKQATLECLYNFKQNLEFYKPEDTEETELLMRLAPLYQQDRELAKQEGRAEGRVEEGQRLVLRQLNRRFGEIDASIIERVSLLSTEQLEALGEALLDFSALSDLEAWLNQVLQ